MQDLLTHDNKFRYQLLSRLRMDCDYYLGYGNRYPKHLWAGSEKRQIETMEFLWNSFSDEDKPEWITWENIQEYKNDMLNISETSGASCLGNVRRSDELSIYQERGYKDRNDYLQQLADDYGVDACMVFSAADLLGPNEDFDGLISSIEDLA